VVLLIVLEEDLKAAEHICRLENLKDITDNDISSNPALPIRINIQQDRCEHLDHLVILPFEEG